MKKKLIGIIVAGVLTACTLLYGCGCSGSQPLPFNVSGKLPNETLVYTVNYQPEYMSSTKKTDYPANGLKVEYGEGTFTTTLTPLTSADKKDIPNTGSDIITDTSVSEFYKIESEFKIDVTVTLSEKEPVTHTETITATVFFTDGATSVAPVYSKEVAEYCIISANEQTAAASVLHSETELFYDKSRFRSVKTYKYFDLSQTLEDATNGDAPTKTVSDYNYRSAIDNAELLFALRYLSLDEKASAAIPVISAGYNGAQNLRVTCDAKSTDDFTVNGIKSAFGYSTYNFRLDDTNKAGTAQYVKIQSAKTENSAGAYLLEYAKPLVYYGTFTNMGWLVFTLSEIK